MATAPSELAWTSRWKAVHPTAQYFPTFGIETAWRQNADVWGYPLEDTEQEVQVNGNVLKGRTFSGVGLVVWNPSTGAEILGWP